MSPTMEERTARASLTRLFEPGDVVGGKLIAKYGAHSALRIAIGAKPAHPFWDVSANELSHALSRWNPRIHDLDPEKDLATIERLGGGFLIPGDEHWPKALDELPNAPWGLWFRGDITQGIPSPERTVALIGSRDSSAYGNQVASEMALALAQRGFCVSAGLGYGIEEIAHQSALAGFQGDGPATIAVTAGGLDRDWPSGTTELAASIRAGGLTLSEIPPGTAPSRTRFLERNRIIAALAGVTCVVESRWRSGALNTAHRALELGRAVGVVPGSTYSAQSAGCHRLLKDRAATLVTDTQDLTELLASWSADRIATASVPVV